MAVSRVSFSRLTLTGAIALLTACGGDDGASPAATATGTLTDSAIAGVSYTTSSGLSGVTDANGHFRYQPGDTVTFRIGGLTLGAVAASGTAATVTPLQIVEAASGLAASEKQNMVANLLILLQSLDSDGDADNGITVAPAAVTALTADVAAALDLTVAPATFAADADVAGLAAAVGNPVVDPEDALAHFKAQFMQDLAGFYTVVQDGGLIAFRINEDGSYLMVESGEADGGGEPGIERGALDWNPQTGEVTVTVDGSLDTNGEWGLSHLGAGEHLYFALNGDDLVVRVSNDGTAETETLQLARVDNGAGLQGAWVLNTGMGAGTSLAVQQFLFLGNGKYVLLDPVGGSEGCEGAGLEYGSYRVSGSTVFFSAILTDTNGCAGLHVDAPGAEDHDRYTVLTVLGNDGARLSVRADDSTESTELIRPVTRLVR